MEESDRFVLFQQYTYPSSHQHISRVPIRPFVVHSDELEMCVCDTHSTGRKCPYHAVLDVAPEERSGAMKAVVESHSPVVEAGQLLLTTRAHTRDEDLGRLRSLRGVVESSEEGAVLEKAAVKLIKAALLHHGVCVHIRLAPFVEYSMRLTFTGLAEGFGPLEEGETAEQRARGLSWLHLVTSMPLIAWQMRLKQRCKAAITSASIALALLAEEGRNWEPLLLRHGLSVWDVELVLRMHLIQGLMMLQFEELPREEEIANFELLVTNTTCVSTGDPTNACNACTFTAVCQDAELNCSLLELIIDKADERGDFQMGSMMRWHLCHLILQGGQGKTFQVSKVLKLVKEARAALEQAAEWGADTNLTPAKEPNTYWPCLGFAARCKAAIKADPSYAQSMMDAYESSEELDEEKRHVMCAQCEKLCDKLQRCSACQLVGYCSKSCQVKHWKAGHKQACAGSKQQTLVQSEQ